MIREICYVMMLRNYFFSSLLKSNLPQYDGFDEDTFTSSSEDEEIVKKKKKKKEEIPLEDIFRQIEENFIPRGRARPDHNDQAHHWKSKWAKGVCPSDLYIGTVFYYVINIT